MASSAGAAGGGVRFIVFSMQLGVAQLVREFTNEWSPRHQRALRFRDIKWEHLRDNKKTNR
jgi:hypothetical protein